MKITIEISDDTKKCIQDRQKILTKTLTGKTLTSSDRIKWERCNIRLSNILVSGYDSVFQTRAINKLLGDNTNDKNTNNKPNKTTDTKPRKSTRTTNERENGGSTQSDTVKT